MASDDNSRRIEDAVQRDFANSMSYGDYLGLDQLLSAQHPRSVPPQHDEPLFILGNKNPDMLPVFDHDPVAQELLTGLLHEPSLYDEFLRFLARAGYAVPASRIERDWTSAYSFDPDLVPTFVGINEDPHAHWGVYEMCEELVDIEDNFQFWRFRHLKTVERTIGTKRGTGGSRGVSFLRKALELTFFPELYAVRAEIGQVTS